MVIELLILIICISRRKVNHFIIITQIIYPLSCHRFEKVIYIIEEINTTGMKKMQTILEKCNNSGAIPAAADILRRGGLVAFPTETVYGLGGDALDPSASARIYAAKGRPSDNPLIVHIAEKKDVWELAEEVPATAEMLMEAFWPGPLTIILKKKPIVPDATTGGLNTVAIRMPSHPAAMEMIRQSGVYVAAPSANRSGRPSPTTAAHVAEDLTGEIDMILDGGPVGIGIESTIVDLTEEVPMILRPGFITREMLEAIVGEVRLDPTLITLEETTQGRETEPDSKLQHPKAPGMRYTHYAPHGTLSIVTDTANPGEVTPAVTGKILELTKEALAEGHVTAVLTTGENGSAYDALMETPGFHRVELGDTDDGQTVASHLYGALRTCDDLKCDVIYSENFRRDELGSAIMNRLIKAAGHRVISV